MCGCNKRKSSVRASSSNSNRVADFSGHADFVEIKFTTVAMRSKAPSPTKVIQSYGYNDYGYRNRDDVFWVHKNDQAAIPSVYVLTI